MKIKHHLSRRIQWIFLVFALLMSAIFSLLILGYSWIIEDNIFNRLVEHEAAYISANFAETGQVSEPRPAFMTLYDSWEELPHAIREKRKVNPKQIEFETGHQGTIHIREIALGNRVVVLAANVSGYEVSRDYLPVISLWLLAGIGLTGLLAAWVATRAARTAVLPLRQLANAVASIGSHEIEPGFAKGFPDNEVGLLANTIESGVIQLQSVLRREINFTRDLSHELRTPIAVLTLLATELETTKRLAPQSIALFQHTVIELDQTISTLLALARQENIELQHIALLPLLEEAIIHHKQLSHDESYNLEIDIPTEMKITCNPHLAKILFNNLLTNATRYAAEPKLHIKVQEADLIFENPKTPEHPASQGIGQGLSLVKRVCDRFHWHMKIEQDETNFRIRITLPESRKTQRAKNKQLYPNNI